MLTPLHLAAQRGYCRIVECLVGYGADVNMLSNEGDTVMHFIVANKNMQPPSSSTPQIQKVIQCGFSHVMCEPAVVYLYYCQSLHKVVACMFRHAPCVVTIALAL